MMNKLSVLVAIDDEERPDLEAICADVIHALEDPEKSHKLVVHSACETGVTEQQILISSFDPIRLALESMSKVAEAHGVRERRLGFLCGVGFGMGLGAILATLAHVLFA